MFKTVHAAQSWIEAIEKFGSKYDLSRMEKAVALLGHPEKAYPIIHIGGTNGKGSTLAFLSHIMAAAGYQVGAFVSPYILNINERFQINQTMISDDDFIDYANQMFDFYHQFGEQTGDHLTFFELMTLISFLYFQDQAVDVAIIEVGLGGRLDATNVVDPLISVITSIGYDHMHILGNTLEAIAQEKLGIVKPKRPLVSGVLDPNLIPLFEAKTLELESELLLITATNDPPSNPQRFRFLDGDYEIQLLGSHQIQNAKCAILTALKLQALGFKISPAAIAKGLFETQWPGRFEKVGRFILEGAHNLNGMQAAVKTIEDYVSEPLTIVFAVMADKDSKAMQTLIEPYAKRMIFTDVKMPRALSKEVLYARSSHPDKTTMPLEAVIEKTHGTTLIIGSLYLVSAIRRQLIEGKDG